MIARVLATSAVVALGVCGSATAKMTSGITVFAGSSMTTVLPLVNSGNTYSFGSSTALATQITNGAPADVFMSANTTAPASLNASGKCGKPVVFTRNTLAIVLPKSNPGGITSIYDLTKSGLTIAEAASSVPVGSYTVQVLNQMGLNSAIQANVVTQETTDAGVVAKVATGQVDAGFVYLSDYVIDPKELVLVKVPAWAQPKIAYSMCIVTASPNQAAAQAWMNKVLSPAGQAIFVKNGFLPISSPVPAIAAISKLKAKPGTSLSVTGANFSGTTSVTFHGVPAKFKIVSGKKITVVVPRRAKSGSITVTNPSGTAASPKSFTVG